MIFLSNLLNFFPKREKAVIDRIEYSKDGLSAVVCYSNGNSYKIRTEKALKEAGVLD